MTKNIIKLNTYKEKTDYQKAIIDRKRVFLNMLTKEKINNKKKKVNKNIFNLL
jgi:hypothetical protein